MVSRARAREVVTTLQNIEQSLRNAGQVEYAHDDGNALANFERVADQVSIRRDQALFTHLIKHLDGITAHIKGHRSQRESIYGRICDARLYLALLAAMIDDEQGGGLEGYAAMVLEQTKGSNVQ